MLSKTDDFGKFQNGLRPDPPPLALFGKYIANRLHKHQNCNEICQIGIDPPFFKVQGNVEYSNYCWGVPVWGTPLGGPPEAPGTPQGSPGVTEF